MIYITWTENIYFRDEKNYKESNQIIEIINAFSKLRQPGLLFLVLIEGISLIIYYIFYFGWTTILKESTSGNMNIGYLFIIIELIKIIPSIINEIAINHKIDYYISLAGAMFINAFLFFIIYLQNSFIWRLIYFGLIYGCLSTYFNFGSINILHNIISLQFSFIFIAFIFCKTFTIAFITGILSVLVFILSICLFSYKKIYKENGLDKNEYQLIPNDNSENNKKVI